MSQLAKIFMWVAIAGLLPLGYGVYSMITELESKRADLSDTQTKLLSTKSELSTTENTLKSTEADKDKIASDLDQAKSQLNDLQTKLGDAQKKADELTQQMSDQKDAVTKAQSQLDALNQQLGGDTPQGLKDKIADATQKLATLQGQQSQMQDQLDKAQQTVALYKDAVERGKTGTMPPGITGKVTWVNRTWNFVVLNIGVNNGVVPNGELVVYRDKVFLGKLKVTSADATTAVADILPDAKGDIQVGDDVLN